MMGIKFDEIASKLHFKMMDFNFDKMTACGNLSSVEN